MHHNKECGCEHHSHQGHGGMESHHKECGYEHHSRQGHGGMASHHGGGGCCHSGGRFQGRHFYTKEEMITHLENYLEQLKAEAKGVEEHINKLKADKE